MSHSLNALSRLNRPGLLVRAARHGMETYNRARDLTRVLQAETPPSPQRAVDELLLAETELEETRVSGDLAYSALRHIEVLTALLAEAQLLRRSIAT